MTDHETISASDREWRRDGLAPVSGRAWFHGLALAGLIGGILLVLGSGCAQDDPDPLAAVHDLTGVPVSRELRSSVAEARRALVAEQPTGTVVDDLDRYHDLRPLIRRPEDRAAAGDELYARWRRDPQNFLWLDLAVTFQRRLRRDDDLAAMLATPILADTNSAIGHYVLAQSIYHETRDGYHYRQADLQRADLDSLQRVWLDTKLALVEYDEGNGLAAAERLLAVLPAARSLAGSRLESIIWHAIAWYLMKEERLDDALHAAVLATAMAERAGYAYTEIQARNLIGSVLERRRESQAALAIWDRSVAQARERNFTWLVSASLSRGAALCAKLADFAGALQLDRVHLAHSIAVADSLNVPRVMMNVADDLRSLGQLDSCLVYHDRARIWVEAYGHPQNRARFPFFLAEYYCHVGDFAKADSLLSVALGRRSQATTATEEARIHLGLLRKGLETGQPDLAYRTLLRMEELRGAIRNDLPDQNFLAEYDLLVATFLARQGEFLRAQEVLSRAELEVAARGGTAWQWELHRTAGELALLRGDGETARTEFEICLNLARQGDSVERAVASRFHLGHVLLETGRFREARQLFQEVDADSAYGGRFRTRLSSLLCAGMASAREERFEDAVARFDRALSLCTPHSPADLRARLHLELGVAQQRLGRVEAAADALLAALDMVRAGAWHVESDELRVFNQDIYRDVTQALVDLYLDHPRLLGRQDPALVTLALTEEGRWHDGDRDNGPVASSASTERILYDSAELERLRERTRQLAPLLVYSVGRARTWAWVATGENLAVHALPGREDLQAKLRPVRADLARPGRPVEPKALADLGNELLGPLDDHWSRGELLRLVPDDVLLATPWSVLPAPRQKDTTEVRFALEHGPICEAPSIADFPVSGEPTSVMSLGIIAFGRDGSVRRGDTAARETDLRHAEEEARSIAAFWPEDRVELRLGDDADWRVLRRTQTGPRRVIHIASHARVSTGAPQQSSLYLAADGEPLTLPMIRRLGCNAELIYLSCCEGASSAGSSGGLMSFARAFLTAGARAVIASTQKVDDEASQQLAMSFYRHWLAGESRAAALRAAQLELAQAGSPWSHPFYWSSYRLMGDGS